jgi:large subunit ribosomal protein L6
VASQSNLYLGSNDKALLNTSASLIHQKIKGLTQGVKVQLNLKGVGYRASLSGSTLILALGYSHKITLTFDKTVQCLCPNPRTIIIKGSDYAKVHQAAAEIRAYRLPEPYKGKGVLYKNEVVSLKEGKKN